MRQIEELQNSILQADAAAELERSRACVYTVSLQNTNTKRPGGGTTEECFVTVHGDQLVSQAVKFRKRALWGAGKKSDIQVTFHGSQLQSIYPRTSMCFEWVRLQPCWQQQANMGGGAAAVQIKTPDNVGNILKIVIDDGVNGVVAREQLARISIARRKSYDRPVVFTLEHSQVRHCLCLCDSATFVSNPVLFLADFLVEIFAGLWHHREGWTGVVPRRARQARSRGGRGGAGARAGARARVRG